MNPKGAQHFPGTTDMLAMIAARTLVRTKDGEQFVGCTMRRGRTVVARVDRFGAARGRDCASVQTSRTSSRLLPALRAASGCVVWSEP